MKSCCCFFFPILLIYTLFSLVFASTLVYFEDWGELLRRRRRMNDSGGTQRPFSFFVAVSMTPWAHDVLHLSIKVLLLLLLLLYSIICQIIWRTVIYFNQRYMSCSVLRGLRPIPYSYSAKMHCHICLGGFWWLNFVLCFNIIANYGKCSMFRWFTYWKSWFPMAMINFP